MRSNIPTVNVLVNEAYKVRAIVDSGATTTLISTGLLDFMTGMKLHPSTLGFFGVGPQKLRFAGILYDVPLRFNDALAVVENIGVY